MTIEQVLSFFDHHNTAIIEGLVAIIILFGLYLGYRGFFAKDDKHGAGHGMDTAELEKTLQKILDNQASAGPSTSARRAKSVEPEAAEDYPEMPVDKEASDEASSSEAGVVRESPAEVQQLRLTLSESQKKIEVLQAQLTVAETKATEAEAAASAAPAAAAGGEANPEMEGKLRDLEARLAEYEIISEDIADLSRYRDENDKLKAEIELLKSKGGGGSSAPDSTSGGAQAVSEQPVAEPAPEPTPEPTPEPAAPAEEVAPDLSALEVDAAALIAEAEATDTAAPASADLIDDELMKEFAAAVEGQKTLDKVGEKAGDGSTEADKKTAENNELMNEFENFVSKKS